MKKFLAAAMLFAAAPAFASDVEIEALTKKSAALYEALDALLASDLSCRTTADCTALPVGDRACGGPGGYVVASTLNPYYASGTLATLAAMTSETDGKLNELTGAVSICIFEMPPQVACRASQCVRGH